MTPAVRGDVLELLDALVRIGSVNPGLAAGIPTVLYGPEGEGAHADVEWVSRSGTRTAAAVLPRLARDFCA
ncbi:MAG: hypothetical protein JO016_01090 [Actinobacteria bacterium]|nr:hypothetical protein [Actinomycetota bacterium]